MKLTHTIYSHLTIDRKSGSVTSCHSEYNRKGLMLSLMLLPYLEEIFQRYPNLKKGYRA